MDALFIAFALVSLFAIGFFFGWLSVDERRQR